MRFFRKAPRRDYRAAVGGHWDDVGRLQFETLVGLGLRPEHTLLDMPCGSFRAGRFFIEYLEPGNYIGVDGDRALIDVGRKHLGRRLLRRRPQLLARRMPAPLPAADLGWIHALFDHIPPDDVRATIREAAISTPRFFATFFLTDTPEEPKRWLRYGSDDGAIVTYPDKEYWHHSRPFVEAAAADAGARVVEWHEYEHPLGLTLVEFAGA